MMRRACGADIKQNVAAVIVTYNRKELLKQCIKKILDQQNATCDVIVVDNASTDGTEKMVREEFDLPQIFYKNTGSNLGGAGGFEYGVGLAARSGYEYIWLMDDDTLPEKNALSELIKAGQKLNGKWGFLSSVAYWIDGSICRMNIQKKDIFTHVGEKEYQSKIVPIKMCSFVSLLVKSEAVVKLGLPIGEYFIWTDDYEFTGRISREYPCYMIPSSRVVHAMKNHLRVDFARDDASRINRYHYIYRNDVHCYRQFGLMGWIYIISKDLYTVGHIIMHSQEKKATKIRVVWKGFREGLHFDPKIEKVSISNISSENNLLGGGNLSKR